MWLIKISFLVIFSLLLVGCSKPNPTPELLDPIYADINKKLIDTKKEIDDMKKTLEERDYEFRTVKPQTGQAKFVQKKIYELKKRIERLSQMQTYWMIRSEARKNYARKEYLKAWKEKRPWPDPTEFEDYKKIQKLQEVKTVWKVEDRLEETGVNKIREEINRQLSFQDGSIKK